MVKHFRIRQTLPKPIFTYILPLEIPLQNPLKDPLKSPSFFSKIQKNLLLGLATLLQNNFSNHNHEGNHKKPLSSRILKLP